MLSEPSPFGQAWFLTGTDTEVGKTFVTCALLHTARRAGLSAVGMKPVAAGATMVSGSRINEDVSRLMAASSPGRASVAEINPYCFLNPIAPHIAAAEESVEIASERIMEAFRALSSRSEVVIVEGVGGFRVPLGQGYDTADLACDLSLPVILVVGMRLGCINHALLTVEAIESRGLRLAGWVANRIDPGMLRFDENLAALEASIAAPLLGVTPRSDPEMASHRLRLPD